MKTFIVLIIFLELAIPTRAQNNGVTNRVAPATASTLRVNSRLATEAVRVVPRTSSGMGATNVASKSGSAVELAPRLNAQHVLLPPVTVRKGQFSEGKNVFPGTLVVGSKQAEVRELELFLEPRPIPLKWDSTNKIFKANLTVGLDSSNHTGAIPLTPPVIVQFFPSNAVVDVSSVTIKESGAGGYQDVVISCTSAKDNPMVTARSDLGELSQSIPVEQMGFYEMMNGILPIPFLFAALFGGGLGGFLSVLRQSKKSPAQMLRRTTIGVGVGLIVVTAVSAGIAVANVTSAMVGREVGVFAIAALAGYMGTPLLDKVAASTFGTDKKTSG